MTRRTNQTLTAWFVAWDLALTAAAWLGMIFLFLAVDPDVTGFPGVLFLVGFVLLGGLVVYGLYAIWRSGR